MKIRHEDARIQIDLTIPEARVLLEELAHVRGGTRMPKLRQVCAELDAALKLTPVVPKLKVEKGKIDDQHI